MRNGTSVITQAPASPRPPGLFKRILYWILDLDDEATLEAGRRRLLNAPGYFDTLSPEARKYIRNYDGPENHGPPLTRRERRDLERRLSSPAW